MRRHEQPLSIPPFRLRPHGRGGASCYLRAAGDGGPDRPPRRARCTSAVPGGRLHLHVRVLHAGAASLGRRGVQPDRGRAGGQKVPTGARPPGSGRLDRGHRPVARSASHASEPGIPSRGCLAQEQAPGRGAGGSRMSEARCAILASQAAGVPDRDAAAPGRASPGEQRSGHRPSAGAPQRGALCRRNPRSLGDSVNAPATGRPPSLAGPLSDPIHGERGHLR